MSNLNTKQSQFNAAMELYRSRKIYAIFGHLVGTVNISLQLFLLYALMDIQLSFTWQMLAFVLAFFLTDFLNGVVHMIMDHNERYEAIYGPLVANFHLHHQTPKYTRRPIPLVYFHESSAKIWLAPFLAFTLFFLVGESFSPFVLHVLVYIGVLSSVAEVSHYLCHTSDSRLARFLARAGILLSREHHAPHHEADNMNYAFLNGWSDPLINRIARTFYPGYKATTDQHFANYARGAGADQR